MKNNPDTYRTDYYCQECKHTFAVRWSEDELENSETPYCPISELLE